jgi:hypothetical protein
VPRVVLLLRNPVTVLAIGAAAVGTVGVFTFAKPQYHPRYESKMIDFSEREYHSPSSVRRAFLTRGVDLRYRASIAGLQHMSNSPKPWDASALQVAVAPRHGKGSWGPELERYDERFDNVLVTYGGEDGELLRRIKAAVGDLR